MLLVRTRLAPSAIHGVGVFAAEAVSAGSPVWRFEPGIDLVIPLGRAAELPEAFQAYLATYAYVTHEFPDAYVLSCDHAKFLNHDEDPAIESRGRTSVARRALRPGDEITSDYRAFVVDWNGFG